MDTTLVNEFNTGFGFAVSQGLPLIGSLVILGVLIYVTKKVFQL